MNFIKWKLRMIKRHLLFWWQRRTRGWTDEDTWALDSSLAKLILPRLQRFQEITFGFPPDVSFEEWLDILNEMIWGFEWVIKYGKDSDHDVANYERAQKAIELFAKWYFYLWW